MARSTSTFTITDEENLHGKNVNSDEKNLLLHQSTNADSTNTKSILYGLDKIKHWFEFKTDFIWSNAIALFSIHVIALYSLITFSYTQNFKSLLFTSLAGIASGIGVTAGAHRLWTHRSYKAKWPLRLMLYIMFHIAGQKAMYDWVRDHRVHHKYTETDADPHNSKRGFFFSHVGWLMMKKHPEVIAKGRQIDMSDVLEDPIVKYGDKYFMLLALLFAFILPTLALVYGFNETWTRSIQMTITRYVIELNAAWTVNSAAHLWGMKPYDKSIMATENYWVSYITVGEGFHNYHHVFPWDYKAAELNVYFGNTTTLVIDLFAKIGWAYDLKTPTPDLVKAIAMSRGDGTHASSHGEEVCESLSKSQ